jgi:hypothetical protein
MDDELSGEIMSRSDRSCGGRWTGFGIACTSCGTTREIYLHPASEDSQRYWVLPCETPGCESPYLFFASIERLPLRKLSLLAKLGWQITNAHWYRLLVGYLVYVRWAPARFRNWFRRYRVNRSLTRHMRRQRRIERRVGSQPDRRFP